MHQNAKIIFRKYGLNYFEGNPKVLEIGPDKYPSSLYEIVNRPCIHWDTLELGESFTKDKCRFSSLKKGQINHITNDPYRFPIGNESYDIVISAFVIEHVPKVWLWVKELTRIIKNKGYLITIAPTSWPYHEAPIDCWRIYPEGMNALYEESNLKILTSKNACYELDLTKRHYPGWTYYNNYKNKFKNFIGWPVTAAYDTITIGHKL
jgi:SAM-dependent methyltransferase